MANQRSQPSLHPRLLHQSPSVNTTASQHAANYENYEQTIPNASDGNIGPARPNNEDGLGVDLLEESDAVTTLEAEDPTRRCQSEGGLTYQEKCSEVSGWEQLSNVCGEPVRPDGFFAGIPGRPTQPFPGHGTLEGSQHTMAPSELWPTRDPEPSGGPARRIMMDSGRPFYPPNSIRALMEWRALGRECLGLMDDILASGPKEHQMALERESRAA